MQPAFPVPRNFNMTVNGAFDHCSPRSMDDRMSVPTDLNMFAPSTFNRKLRPVLTLDHIANIKCPVVSRPFVFSTCWKLMLRSL